MGETDKPKRWEYGELRSTKIMTGTFGIYIAYDMDKYLAIVEPMAEKLEAVKKTWLENAKTMAGDPELNDVLCEIGTALTGVQTYDLKEMVKAVEGS